MTVNALGILDFDGGGLQTSHPVGLWNSQGSLLSQLTIAAGTANPLTGQYRYGSIAPLTLTAGNTYVLGAYFAPVIDRCGANCGDEIIALSAQTFDPRLTFIQSLQTRAVIGTDTLAFPNLGKNMLASSNFPC